MDNVKAEESSIPTPQPVAAGWLLNEIKAGRVKTVATTDKQEGRKLVGAISYLAGRQGIELVINPLNAERTRFHFDCVVKL